MTIVNGVIFRGKTDGKVRFITESGRIYIWAYGAWRFAHQFNDETYNMIQRSVGNGFSDIYLASSRKVFMEKRVALDPIDYQVVESTGLRLNKMRFLFRKFRLPGFSKMRLLRSVKRHVST